MKSVIQTINDSLEQELVTPWEMDLKESISQPGSLRHDVPYLLRNDGKVFAGPGYVHPYILYNVNDSLASNLVDALDVYGGDWWWFFYQNSNNPATKKLLKDCVQYLADMALGEAESEVDLYEYFRFEPESLQSLMDRFEIQPRSSQEPISEGHIRGLEGCLEDLNDRCNQEFLRFRLGGLFFSDPTKGREIYFRVSSTNFNWFNLIWELVYRNRQTLQSVTISADSQSGKNIGTPVYILDGQPVDHMPVEEFVELSGRPLVEHKQYVQEEFGPFHNHNRFCAHHKIYIEDCFREIEK